MSEHVPVVESEIRHAICMFLVRTEIATRATNSALGALKALHEVPALLVLDLLLPDESGIEVIRELPTRI